MLKYPLLLRELLANTPESDHSRNDLETAMKKIQSVIDTVWKIFDFFLNLFKTKIFFVFSF